MTHAIVRVVFRGRTRYAFVAAAFLALVQPFLTPFMPDLAGWAPNHGHVYASGEAVPHSHPWDRDGQAVDPSPDNVPPGYIFHLCEIHPDGLVPVGDGQAPASTSPQTTSTEAPDDESTEEDVAFLFDLKLTGSILLAHGAPPLGCTGVTFPVASTHPVMPIEASTTPTVPPPRV